MTRQQPTKITTSQAIAAATAAGIDFSQDFHILSSSQVDRLNEIRKSHGYRAPSAKVRNGSPARYFFSYLAKANNK